MRARNQYNIDMIALGVGNETFQDELQVIAGPGNTNRLFQVKNFAQLRDVVEQLQEIICEEIPTTTTTSPAPTTTQTTTESTTSPNIPPFPCSKPADVVFLIDSSYSISAPDWVKAKQFVSYLINSLDIGLSSINVGIVVYGTGIGDAVSLKPFIDKTELRQRASGLIQPPVGATNTAVGLEYVRNMIRTEGRSGVPHIAIVITDGMSDVPADTRDQAMLAKREGITIFVVGVGDRVVKQEMEDMATSPETLFESPDFKYLIGMVELLRNKICTTIVRTTTPIPSTTPTTSTTPPPIPELCKECLVEGGVGFNPFPQDCEKYVMCLPIGMTYDPKIKSCPFGMFWSNEAVSCLDARYVECPADKCKAMGNSQTYSSGSSGCRNYFRCSNGRSTPLCCETGYKYVDGIGCSRDPSCQDPCPLEITIFNQGACGFRPDPSSYYTYLEVVPGQGNIKRSCDPGQVYSQKLCGCTFDAAQVIPGIVCAPAVNLTFDGSFEDSSPKPQLINVHRVGITTSGSAYFNGDGYLTIPATANKNLGDKFVIRLKYRVKRDNIQGQAWESTWPGGFEQWFKNASDHGSNFTVVTGTTGVTEPDPGKPTGAETNPLEVITISRNGTVIRDPRYVMKQNVTWPDPSQPRPDVIQLGNLVSLSTPTVENGIVYIPNGKNKLLVQETVEGTPGSIRNTWKIVTINADGKTGTVEEKGQGSVPLNIQQKYGFDLRPPLVDRWFILAPGGYVMENGEGPIPDDVLNRYAGFTPGTLVKVFERGETIERWQVSKPDGTQLVEGNGQIPQTIVTANKLDTVLAPTQMTITWNILAADGKVLETGTGAIPDNIVQKYISNPSVTVLKSTSRDGHASHWEVRRPSGVKIIEGRGSLPQGIAQFVQGNVKLPQISVINRWTVTLPDGTVRTGTGEIPQEILDLFKQHGSSANQGSASGGQMVNRWTVTLPDGTVRSGVGEIPADIKALMANLGPGVQRSWQVTLPDGTVRSGVGEMPSDLMAYLKIQGQGKRRRRAAHTNGVMDLLSNCGAAPSMTPSLHLYTTHHDVTFSVLTSQSSTGKSVSLPVHDGLNDVIFMYDGSHLTGIVNGVVRKQPLTGTILTKSSPVMLGQCLIRDQNHFVGEIDMFEMYHCLP